MLHREQAWADAHGLVLHVFDRLRWNTCNTILLVFTPRGHGEAFGGEAIVYRNSTSLPP